MQRYIERLLIRKLAASVRSLPVTAIIGPRQCGKSTLAKSFNASIPRTLHLDLEKPSDLAMLRDPEGFFSSNRGILICLDEIQRVPELFPLMRSEVDETGKNGRFLLLGSASPELLRQGSESLAGRIRWLELTPFLLPEIAPDPDSSIVRRFWLRGGFPRSWLASTNRESFEWRKDFIRALLERDIPQLGARIPAKTMERFLQMCAHVHGQIFNSSMLGESLGVSHHTARSYLDLLQQTWHVRVLPPFSGNMRKRLVKSPKIFIRDSGILHALHGIQSFNELLGHPVYGTSWEGFVVENVLSLASDWKASFYRASSGTEIDLLLEKGKHRIAVECKASSAPSMTKGHYVALRDLEATEAWIIAPVREPYPVGEKTTVSPLNSLLAYIERRRR
jgi:predicted AAA+ superfamily ATPase